MSFSLGPKGGITDPHIIALLIKLTQLIQKHKYDSPETQSFIEQHRETTFVDNLSQCMHTFGELANALGPLINGIQIEQEEDIPGEGWQQGGGWEASQKDSTDPADWWKT